MARCSLCSKSGFFLKTNRDGVCETCEVGLVAEVSSAARVIKQSIEIAETTKNLHTMLSRLNVAEGNCRQLLQYEERGVRTIDPAPSELIKITKSTRRTAVLDWIERELLAARAKSKAATTPTNKTGGYSKLLEKIGAIYAEVDFTTEIRAVELEVRRELDAVRLKVDIERAEKFAFKGQKKRACDAYLDALFLLRSDSIPDHEQEADISQIESRIRELGGEVPH